MKNPTLLTLQTNLISAQEDIFEKLKKLFKDKAVEAHVFGSVARGDADAYSDIDIWFTFNDGDFKEIYEKRFEYYQLIGDIVHICEAPQNAPIGGVHTAILVRTNEGLLIIDVSLCPLSTSYITKEGKTLFGADLPKGAIGYNPKKVQVDKNYRLDFFICFIFNAIKKIARNEQFPLEGVLREYENLYKNYGISVESLERVEQNLSTLEKMIENTKKVANEKQKETLVEIHNFAQKVLSV